MAVAFTPYTKEREGDRTGEREGGSRMATSNRCTAACSDDKQHSNIEKQKPCKVYSYRVRKKNNSTAWNPFPSARIKKKKNQKTISMDTSTPAYVLGGSQLWKLTFSRESEI